jgi:hypothetical protein
VRPAELVDRVNGVLYPCEGGGSASPRPAIPFCRPANPPNDPPLSGPSGALMAIASGKVINGPPYLAFCVPYD